MPCKSVLTTGSWSWNNPQSHLCADSGKSFFPSKMLMSTRVPRLHQSWREENQLYLNSPQNVLSTVVFSPCPEVSSQYKTVSTRNLLLSLVTRKLNTLMSLPYWCVVFYSALNEMIMMKYMKYIIYNVLNLNIQRPWLGSSMSHGT